MLLIELANGEGLIKMNQSRIEVLRCLIRMSTNILPILPSIAFFTDREGIVPLKQAYPALTILRSHDARVGRLALGYKIMGFGAEFISLFEITFEGCNF